MWFCEPFLFPFLNNSYSLPFQFPIPDNHSSIHQITNSTIPNPALLFIRIYKNIPVDTHPVLPAHFIPLRCGTLPLHYVNAFFLPTPASHDKKRVPLVRYPFFIRTKTHSLHSVTAIPCSIPFIRRIKPGSVRFLRSFRLDAKECQ